MQAIGPDLRQALAPGRRTLTMEQDAHAGSAADAGGAPHARGTLPRLQLGGFRDQRPVVAKAEHAVRTADEAATLGG